MCRNDSNDNTEPNIRDISHISATSERFTYLRENYPEFVYRGYDITDNGDAYHISYDFEIPGLESFAPTWDFPKLTDIQPVDVALLERLAFLLGMTESISYYKIACPKKFVIKCGMLSDEQIKWWHKLLYNGLGEFMYRNGIDVTEDELVTMILDHDTEGSSGKDRATEVLNVLSDTRTYKGCLVPVGGGKDSVVSLELLKGRDIVTYSVNGNQTTKNVIDICDHKSGDYVAKRTLDKRMIMLNAAGYLNGHTPFSAIVAFSSVIAAYITGRKYICLSNENSANESTVKDSFVNHQYSKSLEFEEDFNRYIEKVTDSDIHYFSMLRPLTELQIAALFAGYRAYHGAFRSCNVGSKKGIWCCDCPKCLFVYIILSPFLSEEELIKIFGEKLLDKESLDKDFRELIGIEENKPFECVGTRREVGAAMKYYRQKGGRSLLTDRYAEYIDSIQGDVADMVHEWSADHLVPEELEKLVHLAINDLKL